MERKLEFLHDKIMYHATEWAKSDVINDDWSNGVVTGLIYAYCSLRFDREIRREYLALLGR